MSLCQTLCTRKRCVKVCIECCACGSSDWYKIKVPVNPVAVVANRTTVQPYTNTATTVIFNNVTVNEIPQNSCNQCNSDPCCCKRKKKKNKCRCNRDPCSCKKRCNDCSDDPCSCKRKKKCGRCRSRSCSGDCSQSSSCNPCGQQNWGCNPCGQQWPCNPCGQQQWGWGPCGFYDSNTGIATVPQGGSGYYILMSTITTDSATGFTAEIRVNGQVIVTTVAAPGVTNVVLQNNRDLYDFQQVSVVVYGSVAANVVSGNLVITRIV